MWLEPDEWQGNAEPEQLQVLSAHPAHRLHSQLNYSSLRELYAVANREPVTIHPDDAQERGIQDGDTVRLWNARGQILAGAVISEGIKPGVICIHEGAWPDLDLTADGICKNGAVNVLTKDLPSSRLGNGCAGNTALAWLEKYNGPELTLTAFEPPAMWVVGFHPAMRNRQCENPVPGKNLSPVDFFDKPPASGGDGAAAHTASAPYQYRA